MTVGGSIDGDYVYLTFGSVVALKFYFGKTEVLVYRLKEVAPIDVSLSESAIVMEILKRIDDVAVNCDVIDKNFSVSMPAESEVIIGFKSGQFAIRLVMVFDLVFVYLSFSNNVTHYLVIFEMNKTIKSIFEKMSGYVVLKSV